MVCVIVFLNLNKFKRLRTNICLSENLILRGMYEFFDQTKKNIDFVHFVYNFNIFSAIGSIWIIISFRGKYIRPTLCVIPILETGTLWNKATPHQLYPCKPENQLYRSF